MKQFSWVLFCLMPIIGAAQNDYYQKKTALAPANPAYSILLKDGTQLRGELIHQDSLEAIIRTSNLGEVRLKSNQIVRMALVGEQAEGDYFPNLFPQTMRITPTAFSAEKGRLYYRNYFLYVSQFEYGINDNWSVGTTFYSFLPTALFSLSTKFSLPVSQRVRLGINAQYAGVRSPDIFSSVLADIGYVQGIVTLGDRLNNTTFGLGWSIANGDLSRNVIGTFGLVRKLSPKLTFISENSILFGSGAITFAGMVSGGVRFDRRRHAFDLAVYLPILGNIGSVPLILFMPFGSYHLRIGK